MSLDAEFAKLLPALNSYFPRVETMTGQQLRTVIRERAVPCRRRVPHPYASPRRARLTGLPPAVVITAGCDPLCSEGSDYAKALVATGVPTIHRDYEGAIHGFITMARLDICTRARAQAWADVSAPLSRSSE